jgi:hypothetical protein
MSRELEQRLRALEVPAETASQERSWQILQRVYAERPAGTARRRVTRFAIAPLLAALTGVLVLTPAGAAVHRWIERTLGVKHARPALFSLPAQGQLLVAGADGTWTVAADGSKRRLGSWRQATWSPHALYVAVARADQLTAVDPLGVPRWSIARPAVSSPRWFAPDGYRVAYLSAGTLRVIDGDGTNDRLLAAGVAPVAPAWQPGHPYRVAYVQRSGAIAVRDADSGQLAWRLPIGRGASVIAWSADGRRLLVVRRGASLVLGADGHRMASLRDGSARYGAISPDGSRVALIDDGGLRIERIDGSVVRVDRSFSGESLGRVAWSPDSRWVLVSWPAADQWVFVRAVGSPRIIAVSRIAEQFGGRHGAQPTLEGWCCTAPAGGA